MAAVRGLLRALGLNVQEEPDPDVPVLMKNVARAV
jgi:hypothetical protein